MNPRHYAENMESCDRQRRRAARRMRPPPWETGEGAPDSDQNSADSHQDLPGEELDEDPYEDEDEDACCLD